MSLVSQALGIKWCLKTDFNAVPPNKLGWNYDTFRVALFCLQWPFKWPWVTYLNSKCLLHIIASCNTVLQEEINNKYNTKYSSKFESLTSNYFNNGLYLSTESLYYYTTPLTNSVFILRELRPNGTYLRQ